MPADNSTPVAERGKPTINAIIDHVSIAPSADASKLAVTLTLTIEFDDLAALDAVMRVVGVLTRRRGMGVG